MRYPEAPPCERTGAGTRPPRERGVRLSSAPALLYPAKRAQEDAGPGARTTTRHVTYGHVARVTRDLADLTMRC